MRRIFADSGAEQRVSAVCKTQRKNYEADFEQIKGRAQADRKLTPAIATHVSSPQR